MKQRCVNRHDVAIVAVHHAIRAATRRQELRRFRDRSASEVVHPGVAPTAAVHQRRFIAAGVGKMFSGLRATISGKASDNQSSTSTDANSSSAAGGEIEDDVPPPRDYPFDPYEVLGCDKDSPLSEVKLKFLARCRDFHPECGGDPESFRALCVAYDRIMQEHGAILCDGSIGTRDNMWHDFKAIEEGAQFFSTKRSWNTKAGTNKKELIPGVDIRRLRLTQTGRDDDHMTPEQYDLLTDEEKLRVKRQKLLPLDDLNNPDWWFHDDLAAEKEDKQEAKTKEVKELERRETFAKQLTGQQLTGGCATAVSGDRSAGDAVQPRLEGGPQGEVNPDAVVKKDPAKIYAGENRLSPGAFDAEGKINEVTYFQQLTKTDGKKIDSEDDVRAFFKETEGWEAAAPGAEKIPEDEKVSMYVPNRDGLTGGMRRRASDGTILYHPNTGANEIVQNEGPIARQAAHAATSVMANPNERRRADVDFINFYIVGFMLAILLGYLQLAKKKFNQEYGDASKNSQLKEHVAADTMMPWWGNDDQYEKAVKRLFVDEWKKARSKARRMKVFQEGIQREEMAMVDKIEKDLDIFNVPDDKLAELRSKAKVAKAMRARDQQQQQQ